MSYAAAGSFLSCLGLLPLLAWAQSIARAQHTVCANRHCDCRSPLKEAADGPLLQKDDQNSQAPAAVHVNLKQRVNALSAIKPDTWTAGLLQRGAEQAAAEQQAAQEQELDELEEEQEEGCAAAQQADGTAAAGAAGAAGASQKLQGAATAAGGGDAAAGNTGGTPAAAAAADADSADSGQPGTSHGQLSLLAGRVQHAQQLLLQVKAVVGSRLGTYPLLWRPAIATLSLQPEQQQLLLRSPTALAALLEWHRQDLGAPLMFHLLQLGTGVEDFVMVPYHGPLICELVAMHLACLQAVRGCDRRKLPDKAGLQGLKKLYGEANYPHRTAGAVADLFDLFNNRSEKRYKALKVAQVRMCCLQLMVCAVWCGWRKRLLLAGP